MGRWFHGTGVGVVTEDDVGPVIRWVAFSTYGYAISGDNIAVVCTRVLYVFLACIFDFHRGVLVDLIDLSKAQ